MTTNIALWQNTPAGQRIQVFPDFVIAGGTASIPAGGAIQILPANTAYAPGVNSPNWFATVRPIATWEIGVVNTEGLALQIALNPVGTAAVAWRTFYIAGGDGAIAAIHSCEHGLHLPTWNCTFSIQNRDAGNASDVVYYFCLRSMP